MISIEKMRPNTGRWKTLLLAMAMAALLMGCEKKDCEQLNYGSLVIDNQTNFNYNIYVDGGFRLLLFSSNSATIERITAGNYTLGAVETDNSNPDFRSRNVDVFSCERAEWVIQ